MVLTNSERRLIVKALVTAATEWAGMAVKYEEAIELSLDFENETVLARQLAILVQGAEEVTIQGIYTPEKAYECAQEIVAREIADLKRDISQEGVKGDRTSEMEER